MKHLVSLLCLLTVTAVAFEGNPVARVELDASRIIQVPVSRDYLTTVQFPSPISDIEGAFLSTEVEAPAKFQIAFRTNSPSFSLRALSSNATASVNVGWKGKTFLFELVESNRPVLSLILVERAPSAPVAQSRPKPLMPVQECLGLARNFAAIQRTNPRLLQGVHRTTPLTKVNHAKFEYLVDEVFRFEAEDTLVFRLTFINKSRSAIVYLPNHTMAVKYADPSFPQAIAEGDSVIPGHGASTTYVAITGVKKETRLALLVASPFEIAFEVPNSQSTNRISSTFQSYPSPQFHSH